MRHLYPSDRVKRSPATWPLWECLPPESLVRLIQYQWEHYGTKLELLMAVPAREFEDLGEIDRIMRQRPKFRRPPG
jgi:hypothetical protein